MRRMVRLAGAFPLLVVFSASAYVLPSWSILLRLSEARDEAQLSNLRVDGALSFFGPSAQEAAKALRLPEGPEAQVAGTLLMKVPGRCRMEAQALDGPTLAAVLSNGRRKGESQAPEAMWTAVEQICRILAIRANSATEGGRSTIERYLEGLKVEIGRSHLDRLGTHVAFVLGRAEERSPQFWVYKDTFQPARIRWTDKNQTAWDVRWFDYSSPITAELFPRMVEVFRNGELALRFSALKADSQTRISDRLY